MIEEKKMIKNEIAKNIGKNDKSELVNKKIKIEDLDFEIEIDFLKNSSKNPEELLRDIESNSEFNSTTLDNLLPKEEKDLKDFDLESCLKSSTNLNKRIQESCSSKIFYDDLRFGIDKKSLPIEIMDTIPLEIQNKLFGVKDQYAAKMVNSKSKQIINKSKKVIYENDLIIPNNELEKKIIDNNCQVTPKIQQEILEKMTKEQIREFQEL